MSWSWLTMPPTAVVPGPCSKIPPRTRLTRVDQGPEPTPHWRFDQRRLGRTRRRTLQQGDLRLHPAIVRCTLTAAATVTAASSAKRRAPGCPRAYCGDAPEATRGGGTRAVHPARAHRLGAAAADVVG